MLTYKVSSCLKLNVRKFNIDPEFVQMDQDFLQNAKMKNKSTKNVHIITIVIIPFNQIEIYGSKICNARKALAFMRK